MIRDGLVIELLIPIELLPDCYAKEQLLTLAPLSTTQVYVVARTGYAEDWAAYIGYPLCVKPEYEGQQAAYLNLLTPHGVLSNGDKLDQATAEVLFPYLKERSYRR